MEKTVKIGIVMPISAINDKDEKHWAEVKEIIIDLCKGIKEYDVNAELVSNDANKEIIHKRIVSNLYESDIVICDVSSNNPNVMFELGMRLAFNKPTIIIKDESSKYNFDTGIIQHIEYSDDLQYKKIRKFEVELKDKIISTISSVNDNKYEAFLDSLGLKNVKASKPKYQEQELTGYIVESLKTIEARIDMLTSFSRMRSIESKALSSSESKKDIIDKHLDILINDVKKNDKDSITFVEIEQFYDCNKYLQTLVPKSIFMRIASGYFENNKITLIPF